MARNWLLELRRDTAANWTAANPTLAAGEPGYELDTGKLKVGDGATAWNALSYFTPATAGVSSLDAITGAVSLHAGTNVTITDNSPGAGQITIAASGGGSSPTTVAASVVTDQSTSSTSYTDLATVGPQLTITVGASGILICTWSAQMDSNILMSIALSGANSFTATDDVALFGGANTGIQDSRSHCFTGLSAGSTTVTCKYRVTGGTHDAQRRELWALTY